MLPFIRSHYRERQLINAIIVLYDNLHCDHDVQVASLMKAGFGEWEAKLFIELIPEAFATPIMEEHGITLSPKFAALDADGVWFEGLLDKQPAYVAGLMLARQHRQSPVMSEGNYLEIAQSSSLYDALRKAQEEGIDTKGGVLAVALHERGLAQHLSGRLHRTSL